MKKVLRPHHIEYLASDLKRRKEINSRYSLRAYARYLGLDPSALSRVLAGKQELSLPVSLRVVKKLKLSLEEKQTFLTSVSEVKRRRAAMFLARGLGDSDLGEVLNSKVEKNGFHSVELSLATHPLFFNHPDSVLAIDRESKVVYANEILGKLLKIHASEVIGKAWKDLNWPIEVLSLMDEQFQSIFLTGSTRKIEIPWVKADHIQYFEYIFAPVFGSDGKVRLVVSCARNMTEHFETREHLNLLSVADNILSSTEDLQIALAKAVQIPLTGPADWCTFHWYEKNQMRHCVGSVAQLGKKKWLEEFLDQLGKGIELKWGFQKVLKTGISDLIPEVETTFSNKSEVSYIELRLYLSLGPHDFIWKSSRCNDLDSI
jgi:PAS domain-containing protein